MKRQKGGRNFVYTKKNMVAENIKKKAEIAAGHNFLVYQPMYWVVLRKNCLFLVN